MNITIADTRFCESAMQSEPEVQLWHFHNNIGLPDTATETERREAALMWTVPSDLDLMELYAWADQKPKAKFRGYVASIYGVMEYWSDEYVIPDENAHPDAMMWFKRTISSEAMLIKMKAKETPVPDLPRMAKAHRGIFRYRFRLIP